MYVNDLPLEEVGFASQGTKCHPLFCIYSRLTRSLTCYGTWSSESPKRRCVTYIVPTHQALGHHSFSRPWRSIQQQVPVGRAVSLGVSRRYGQGQYLLQQVCGEHVSALVQSDELLFPWVRCSPRV